MTTYYMRGNNINMIRKINLGNKKEAVKAFETFKANDYVSLDIELLNSHLKNSERINDFFPKCSEFYKLDKSQRTILIHFLVHTLVI